MKCHKPIGFYSLKSLFNPEKLITKHQGRNQYAPDLFEFVAKQPQIERTWFIKLVVALTVMGLAACRHVLNPVSPAWTSIT